MRDQCFCRLGIKALFTAVAADEIRTVYASAMN